MKSNTGARLLGEELTSSRISVMAACWSRASRSSAVSRRIVSSGVSGARSAPKEAHPLRVLAGAERARLPPFRVAAVSRGEALCIVRIAAADHNGHVVTAQRFIYLERLSTR